MKTLTKLFIVAILGVSLVQGAGFEKTVKSRATNVELSSQKPLTTGNNTLNLVVLNDKFKNSTVILKLFMPAMPGMPYMESLSKAKNLGDGKYTSEVNISMSGTWQLHIFITPKEGKKIRVKTSLNV